MMKATLLVMFSVFTLVFCPPARAQIEQRSHASLENQNIQFFDDAMNRSAGFLKKHLVE